MTRAKNALLFLMLLLLVACDGGQSSPRAAFGELQSALAAQDGARLVSLHDPESRAFYRAQVREVRARLARGDAFGEIFPGGGPTVTHFTEGTEDEAVARFVLRSSEIAARADWVISGSVVGEEREDETHVRLRVRGDSKDGTEERELFFVRTADGWKHDAFRQYRSNR